MVVWWIVKTRPRAIVHHGHPRHQASGNSPPWSSSSPRGNGFDYSPNSHEITVLLPNNNIHVYTRYHEDSIRPTLHISSKWNWSLTSLKDTLSLMRRLTICYQKHCSVYFRSTFVDCICVFNYQLSIIWFYFSITSTSLFLIILWAGYQAMV